MTKSISQHLKDNPSYFKWGVKRLAKRFNCSQRKMDEILYGLRFYKKQYLDNLG